METRRSTTARKPSGGLAIRLLGEIRAATRRGDDRPARLEANASVARFSRRHGDSPFAPDTLRPVVGRARRSARRPALELDQIASAGERGGRRAPQRRPRTHRFHAGQRAYRRPAPRSAANRRFAAAPLAELEVAAGLLQGEFLDGLDLPSCYRFHHWCLAERERWGVVAPPGARGRGGQARRRAGSRPAVRARNGGRRSLVRGRAWSPRRLARRAGPPQGSAGSLRLRARIVVSASWGRLWSGTSRPRSRLATSRRAKCARRAPTASLPKRRLPRRRSRRRPVSSGAPPNKTRRGRR